MTPEEVADIQSNEIVRHGKIIRCLESQLGTAVYTLRLIAGHTTTDEGMVDAIEHDTAHDSIIHMARSTLALLKDQAKHENTQ